MHSLLYLFLLFLAFPAVSKPTTPPKILYEAVGQLEVWEQTALTEWRRTLQYGGIPYFVFVSIQDREVWFTTRTPQCLGSRQKRIFYWQRGKVTGQSLSCAGDINPRTILPVYLLEFITPLPRGVEQFLERLRQDYVDNVVPWPQV